MPARLHVARDESDHDKSDIRAAARVVVGDRPKHLPLWHSDERPQTRADCAPGGALHVRPCPFMSCVHHARQTVKPPLWGEIVETCELDIADRDGVTLDEVGAFMGVSRERVRQIEERAIAKLARVAPWLAESLEDARAATSGAAKTLRHKALIAVAGRRRRLNIKSEEELEGSDDE